MDIELVIHILKNPFGWSEGQQRCARLIAAHILERCRAESSGCLAITEWDTTCVPQSEENK